MSNEELRALEVVPAGLSAEELDDFAMKHLVVNYQLRGCSAAEALARAGVDRSNAWATKLRRRFEEYGVQGLLDLRRFNRKVEEVMSTKVKNIVLAFWHSYPAAGAVKLANMTRDACRRLSLSAPAASTVKRYLDGLPEAVKMTRGGHFEEYDKQGRPTVPFRPTTYANQRAQADHKRLDLWSRVLENGVWLPVVVWVTVLLDDYSRAILGISMTTHAANSWSITQAFRHAFLPKAEPGWLVHGKPAVFQCDRGADFMSASVASALAVLGIELDPDPAYYPNRKGKIERFFRTMDQACLRGLPGHMEAIGTSEGAAKKHINELLTPEQILREIKRWIVEEYHQRTHDSTDRKPLELWQETVDLRVPSEEEVFRVLLRQDAKTRKVQPMMKFKKNGQGGVYWSPDLLPYYGKEVRVAYNPENVSRIALFSLDKGEFLAEPWLIGHPDCPYTREQVKKEAAAYRRGLKSRIDQYKEFAKQLEAEARAGEEWQEARDEVAADAESDTDPDEDSVDPEDEEAQKLLEKMENRRWVEEQDDEEQDDDEEVAP